MLCRALVGNPVFDCHAICGHTADDDNAEPNLPKILTEAGEADATKLPCYECMSLHVFSFREPPNGLHYLRGVGVDNA